MVLRPWLHALFAFSVAISFATNARAEFQKVPKERCKRFFKNLLEDVDEDLVAVPYFRRQLQDIYRVLNGSFSNPGELVEAAVSEDIRRAAYRLGALTKALRDIDPVAYKSIQSEIKTLEKALGDFNSEIEMVELLRTDPELREHLTPEIEAYFRGRVVAMRDDMLRTFRRQGWIDSLDAYRRIFDTLEDSEPIWKTKQLKREVAGQLAKRLRRIEKDLKNGVYKPHEIEEGVHELRRELRIFPLTVSAVERVFRLSNQVRIALGAPEVPAVTWLVPRVEKVVKNPIVLPMDGYLQVLRWIKDLGELKARDGLKAVIAKAVQDGELGPSGKPLLDALLKSDTSKESMKQTVKKAEEIFDQILKSKVLSKTADILEQSDAY